MLFARRLLPWAVAATCALSAAGCSTAKPVDRGATSPGTAPVAWGGSGAPSVGIAAADPSAAAADANAAAADANAAAAGARRARGGAQRVVVTPPRDARCGPDSIRRQPDALADLDRDGALERASVVRDGRKLRIGLHRVPGLAELASFVIDGDYVEVGATRCLGRQQGDLWLHVGVAHDPKGERWSHTLLHLEGGKLVPVVAGIKQSSLHFDLDGDGCVDPLVLDDQGRGRALRAGKWLQLPPAVDPMRLGGLPMGYGQQRAVDLDGDGDLDLVAVSGTELAIVHAGDFGSVWSLPGRVWSANVTTFGGKTAIVANVDGGLQVIAATLAHERLASFQREIYVKLVPELDPKGDGSMLVLHAQGSELLDAAAPGALAAVGVSLGLPADDAAPRLGPARFTPRGAPELLAVRTLKRGHPMIAFPDSEARYQLVLLPPGAKGDGRTIREAEINGELGIEASAVDLEGDGVFEIVLHESAGYSTCDMKGGGASSTLYLLDGSGAVLWADEKRHSSWDSGSRGVDLEAHARPLDLWGDGRRAIRVRVGGTERYLAPAGAELPTSIPACLE